MVRCDQHNSTRLISTSLVYTLSYGGKQLLVNRDKAPHITRCPQHPTLQGVEDSWKVTISDTTSTHIVFLCHSLCLSHSSVALIYLKEKKNKKTCCLIIKHIEFSLLFYKQHTPLDQSPIVPKQAQNPRVGHGTQKAFVTWPHVATFNRQWDKCFTCITVLL